MSDDLVKRLFADELPNEGQLEREARIVLHSLLKEAADEIERLQKRIAVMAVEKSLLDARRTSGYVSQTIEVGTGDFSKYRNVFKSGVKDEE
jgi:hypothetical protein